MHRYLVATASLLILAVTDTTAAWAGWGCGFRWPGLQSDRNGSVWAIPSEKDWTLVVNKQSGQHHLDYDPAEDFGRTKMNVKMLAAAVETFRIDVSPNGGNRGTLAIVWENTEASIPFTVLQ